MHIVQFLLAFLFAEDIERVESPLPEAVVGPVMDRGRQPQASKHLPAPGMLRVFMKCLEDTVGRLLFEALED